MSYTFRVLFSGLCAFVPERPFATGDPGAVTVLLPNVLNPRALKNKASNETDVDVLNPHFPLVSFDLADLHPQSPRKADLRRKDTGRGACLLLGEEFSFILRNAPAAQQAVAAPPAVAVASFDPQADPQNLRDESSLFWLARLGQANPGAIVDRALLDFSKDMNLEKVIARARLTQGALRVSQRSEKDCTFEPAGNGHPDITQRIATELALDFEGVEGNVVIVTRGKAQRSITLSPVARPDLVEVRIQNIEIDDFLGIPLNLRNKKEVPDFEVFYDLLAKPANQGAVVVPRFPKQPDPGDDVTLQNPSLCPPSELAAA
jgi:hypothetical protein